MKKAGEDRRAYRAPQVILLCGYGVLGGQVEGAGRTLNRETRVDLCNSASKENSEGNKFRAGSEFLSCLDKGFISVYQSRGNRTRRGGNL